MSGIKTVFGGASISKPPFETAKDIEPLLQALEAGGVDTIDTAQIYGQPQGGSEKVLGEAKAGTRFTIDTKHAGAAKPGASRADMVQWAKDSIERLNMEKVDIFYIHGPDSTVSTEESLAGINDVYKLGLFKRFGLSNYTAEGVQEVYDHCKEKGYVLPTVYQGNYSAVARRYETILFPTLRKLGISFFAYSPLAGGLLTKTKQQIHDGAGRFAEGGMYHKMYSKPSILGALEQWEEIAKDAGCSRADLAYRWVKYDSSLSPDHGDAIIVGASSVDQVKQTLEGMKAGPLDKKTLQKIDEIWATVEHEAPVDNFSAMKK